MESKLNSLLFEQQRYICFKYYENEFETMRFLFDKMPEKPRNRCGILSLQLLKSLEEEENLAFSLKNNETKINESKYLRQQGNDLFTAKQQRNILGACRLYNDAIFAALDTYNSNELALGFANRALALQTFGYYQQAYDDCVCALSLGYPEVIKHKIITRQAYCALKLKNTDLMKKHLSELQQLKLNDNFEKQCKDLQKSFEELLQEIVNKKENLQNNKELALNRETQEIITTKSERGRYMQATGFIGKNQLIFTEKASAFVAVGDTRLCHQCGTVNFIPLPCLHCRGRVNYCSLKCKEDHNFIHVYECKAYRFQLFSHDGIPHLALRILLDNGLMSILDELKIEDKKSTIDIWNALQEGGEIWRNNKIAYAGSLRMMSHLDKMSLLDVEWMALVSHHLVIYLKNYTTYFVKLNKYNDTIDWELLTASLILRHFGQSILNAHSLLTIIPRPLAYCTKTDFRLLNDNVWSSPWRVKCGFLHNFSYYDNVASIILPYSSLCNHSCVQSLQPKFNGRYVSTFALRDFNKGDEITHCYDVDYRKAKRSSRWEKLQKNYHFMCQCEDCLHPELEDLEFNKHHQYRCDNLKCRQIFVPNIPHKPSLNWWQSDHPNGTIDTTINCTICGFEQRLEWYHEFKRLMFKVMESKARRRMYKIFKNLKNNLLGLNDARMYVAMKMTHEWFMLPYINIPLSDQDYCEIIDMLEYSLEVNKSECSINSIEYVCEMTYLWDLLAKRKYKCSSAVMNEMLAALNVIADDLKVVFLNYYNDYIKDI